MSFASYTNCVLKAFRSHTKPAEIVKKKRDIVSGVAEFHNYTSDSVLYVGFNPAIVSETANTIAVTHVTNEVVDYLHEVGIQFIHKPLS